MRNNTPTATDDDAVLSAGTNSTSPVEKTTAVFVNTPEPLVANLTVTVWTAPVPNGPKVPTTACPITVGLLPTELVADTKLNPAGTALL